MCNGGKQTINTCTEGLVWDAEQRFCSWPDQVECKKGKRPWAEMTDNKGGDTQKIEQRILFNILQLIYIKFFQ